VENTCRNQPEKKLIHESSWKLAYVHSDRKLAHMSS